MRVLLIMLLVLACTESYSARAETLPFRVDRDASFVSLVPYQWFAGDPPESYLWRVTGSLDLVFDEVAGTASIVNIDLFGIGISETVFGDELSEAEDQTIYLDQNLLADGRFVASNLIAFGDRPADFFAPWENPSPPFGEGEITFTFPPRPGRHPYYEALLTDRGLRLFGGADTRFADGAMRRVDLTLTKIPEPASWIIMLLLAGTAALRAFSDNSRTRAVSG